MYIYGDNRGGHEVHREIVSTMAQQDFAVALNTGDLVYYGSLQFLWDDFMEIIDPICDSTLSPPVYLAAVGNHEVEEGQQGYQLWHQNLFWLPGNGEFYFYDYENVRLIVLDSNRDDLGGAQRDSLVTWLSDNPKDWTFVAWHHPSYPFGSKSRHKESRKEWWPLLYDYGVDIVFNGHAHYYARSHPIKPVSESPLGVRDTLRGVVQIITAGGGAPLYEIQKESSNEMFFDTLFAHGEDQEHHFCEITITNLELVLQAKFPDGHVFDTLVLKKGKKGDVNSDGITDLLDVIAVIDHILELELLSGEALVRADGNGDAYVDLLDLLIIVREIMEINNPGAVRLQIH